MLSGKECVVLLYNGPCAVSSLYAIFLYKPFVPWRYLKIKSH